MNSPVDSAITGSAAAAPSAASTHAPRQACELIAHRGESHDAPENTLAAINLAWRRGAMAVEIDVHLTRDAKLAVIHDPDTARVTANAARLVVAESTFSQLRSLDVGVWKGQSFAGQKIPLLQEVIATIPPEDHRRLIIEIKPGPETVDPLAEAIESSGRTSDRFVLISFNADSLRAARQRLPQIRTLYLSFIRQDKQTGGWSPTAEELIAMAHAARADGVGVSVCDAITPEFVATFKQADLACTVWTVDTVEQARRMIRAGVDAITTNRAAWLAEQLRATPCE
jgi:glycerophosphoryl diester phosphodiesterase